MNQDELCDAFILYLKGKLGPEIRQGADVIFFSSITNDPMEVRSTMQILKRDNVVSTQSNNTLTNHGNVIANDITTKGYVAMAKLRDFKETREEENHRFARNADTRSQTANIISLYSFVFSGIAMIIPVLLSQLGCLWKIISVFGVVAALLIVFLLVYKKSKPIKRKE